MPSRRSEPNDQRAFDPYYGAPVRRSAATGPSELVANLNKAMGERLKTLAWMDDATRAEVQRRWGPWMQKYGYNA